MPWSSVPHHERVGRSRKHMREEPGRQPSHGHAPVVLVPSTSRDTERCTAGKRGCHRWRMGVDLRVGQAGVGVEMLDRSRVNVEPACIACTHPEARGIGGQRGDLQGRKREASNLRSGRVRASCHCTSTGHGDGCRANRSPVGIGSSAVMSRESASAARSCRMVVALRPSTPKSRTPSPAVAMTSCGSVALPQSANGERAQRSGRQIEAVCARCGAAYRRRHSRRDRLGR